MTNLYGIQSIDFSKARDTLGSSFEAQDVDPTVLNRKPVQTTFLADFFGVTPNPVKSKNLVKTIVTKAGIQLPDAKRYDEIVGKLDSQSGEDKLFNIGSWGLAWHVPVSDIRDKINPVTGKEYTTEEKAAEMSINAQMAWDALLGVQMTTLLTTDITYLGTAAAQGKHQTYNFYQEFYGTTRPAAVSMQFANVSADRRVLFNDQLERLQEDALKEGVVGRRPVVLCGTTFFNNAVQDEEAAGNPRPIQSGPDLLSNPIPSYVAGGFPHQYFDSSTTGIRFIKVPDVVSTGLGIGANNAYMVWEGIDYFEKAYTRADTFDALNGTIQETYSWSKDTNRGLFRIEESNHLILSLRPKLIRALTV